MPSSTDLLTRRRPDPLHLSMETRAETMARRQTENPPDREVENNTPPAWLGAPMLASFAILILAIGYVAAPYVGWGR